LRILILHAYSAENLGDGLLVRETLSLVRNAFGTDVDTTVAASHPETFSDLTVEVVDSGIGRLGYNARYVRLLWGIRNYDLIVAVGGGYLRAGTPIEALKSALIHGPQLIAARYSKRATVYLPQSIGPVRYGLRRPLSRLLRRMSVVALRDDRSMVEFADANPVRYPDLALIGEQAIEPRRLDPESSPILSVRSVRGKVPSGVMELAKKLADFDVYIQSTTSGNDDTDATKQLGDRDVVSRQDLLNSRGNRPRVIVAVRLHAALMALQAGHYVVHLAYERKGFGAFADLGLSEYVHNVNNFDTELVLAQAKLLLRSESERERYRQGIESTSRSRNCARGALVDALKASVEQ
jgi:polysaccharide pyruvyl transferase WcaK-like protein